MIHMTKIPDPRNKEDCERVTVAIDNGSSIDQLCDAFTNFLRGCGYVFDGEVELVPPGGEE